MYHQILVPLDSSYTSQASLKEAQRFALELHAKIRLVHVVDLAQFAWNGNELAHLSEFGHTLYQMGKQILNEAALLFSQAGLEAEASLLESWEGSPAKAIIEESRNWGADLIVMGTHGYSGLTHMILGSVAESVVRHARVPVLLIRTPEPQKDVV